MNNEEKKIKKKNYEDYSKPLIQVGLLITDYSSIYFGYLLPGRPIILAPTDEDYYIKNLGILLESYDFWSLCPKFLGQYNLQAEII